jgi:hypothetical protein
MEGMENNQMSETSAMPEEDNDDQKMIDKIVKDNKDKPDQKTGQVLPMHPLEETNNTTDNNAQSTGSEQQGFETGRRKTRGNNIDYAATMEDAYDDLNNILGSDGIQRLTADTQNLIKQQVQLARAVENMTPMLNSLTPMVNELKQAIGYDN